MLKDLAVRVVFVLFFSEVGFFGGGAVKWLDDISGVMLNFFFPQHL